MLSTIYSAGLSGIDGFIVSVECDSQKKLFSFDLKDADDLRDLSRACEAYIVNHLGRNFDSLDFYKVVK